ncbi:MAG: NAD(+) synthase, partial [Micrococcales bacterium]
MSDFNNLYRHGFARVAAVTMPIHLVNPQANAEAVIDVARRCHDDAVAIAVFPELNLVGYSLDDLAMQDVLLEQADAAIGWIAGRCADLLPLLVLGAPLRHRNRVFNCAVAVHRGRVLAVAPKSYLPTYREFYERRLYGAGDDQRGQQVDVAGQRVPFGPEVILESTDVPGLAVHMEVCEDLWLPIPPSSEAALAGASVLVNLSGSPITVAKAQDRRLMCRSQSARCLAAYVYAAAGEGESSTDLSWDGQTVIYQNGQLLAESERFPDATRMSLADVDLDQVRADRVRQGTFDDNRRSHSQRIAEFRRVPFELSPPTGDLGLRRPLDRFPFVPNEESRLALDCYEAYNIQVSGLEQRLRAIGNPKIVIGVSGGLDSTHALIVAARAMDRLGRPRTDILAFTMPGFATTEHTRSNAEELSRALGVTFEQIDITPAARQMLTDMDHPFAHGREVYDVTFENVQAGLRTDYLFRLASHHRGLVLGTGDLSELALGWCTYGVGDQMSHYAVNTGVPKTLIQHLIRWVISSEEFGDDVDAVLQEILDTEITPELVPV